MFHARFDSSIEWYNQLFCCSSYDSKNVQIEDFSIEILVADASNISKDSSRNVFQMFPRCSKDNLTSSIQWPTETFDKSNNKVHVFCHSPFRLGTDRSHLSRSFRVKYLSLNLLISRNRPLSLPPFVIVISCSTTSGSNNEHSSKFRWCPQSWPVGVPAGVSGTRA